MPETLPFRDMEGEDLATTVLTCEGDIKDPTFPFKLQLLVNKLQNLISDEENPIKVTKVEPWNSVRVTFNIPLEAAQRLRQLAERGDRVLRELGILSVQIEGDQVITLTLASQYSEPQEIVLRKTSDEQGDVASVSFNLPNSEPVPGPSTAEPAHKNISQFLGHIVGGASASAAATSSSVRLEKTASPKPESSISFRSPNVIAPSSTEPIPFPPASVATTTAAAVPSASRASPNVSVKSSTGFGPFPFASMTHAMNTKNSATSPQYQPVLHAAGGSSRMSFTTSTTQITNAILSSTCTAISSTSSVSSKVSNSSLKVPRTVSNSAFNSVVSRAPPPNAISTASRANVALSSPLLVNLLQSETSSMQQNNKLMPPPSPASNQAAKRKRKPRKSKDKMLDEDVSSPSFSASPSPPYQSHAGARSPGGFDPLSVLSQPLNVPLTNTTISPPSPQITNIHPTAQGQPHVPTIKAQTSNIHSQVQGLLPVSLQSQVQGQPMVSTNRSLGQNLSAFRQSQGPRTVPNIHPQAQGQPQVHTGNLPLHTHIPVDASHLPRNPVGGLQSYAMSAPRTIPMNPTRSLFAGRDASSLMKVSDKTNKESGPLRSDRSSAPSTPSTSTPDSNPFPSPPSSTDGSKTKHLINPFTGQLEPMPSDEEEEEESIGSLPPFPDFEMDTSEKSHSERSLSDGGKDNNLSSDTDSGISKSITDVSQSSTEGLTAESVKDVKREAVPKTDTISTASVTSTVPGEKIKLRLKIDSKTIRESKESEAKEKRLKDSNPPFNQKVDVAIVSIPNQKKTATPASVPEPRVPPLHISLRGPNSAVVVSPRKDDSKSRHASNKEEHSNADIPCKANQKKVRSPRTARTGDVSAVALSASGRTADSVDRRVRGNNNKDFKKIKDDFWNQNVKNMSMSGGGIVEVSEKVSSSRISSYETYLSGTSVSNSVAQRKASSSLFSLAARDSCKSEVMTLTSCSTGESVILHTFAGSKSPLPLQVATVSETEALPADASQTTKKEVSSNPSSIILPINRTESAVDKITNISADTLCEISIPSNDDAFSNSRKSPRMQNNNLPHSPIAPVDSKTIVQNTNCPSDQTHLQSASSSKVVSTVPLSSNSASSPTCSANETASSLNVQTQVSDSTDASRLPTLEVGVANTSSNVSSSTDSHKLQNNHQCNTRSVSNGTEHTDSVNTEINVQNETPLLEHKSLHEENTSANEVQKSTDVSKIPTANLTESSENDSAKNQSLDSSVSQPSNYDIDKCKRLSNLSESSDSSLSSITPVPNDNKEVVAASDKDACIVEMKKSPIAKIISVDNLPIQPHVIEVPSQQSSPAVPNILAKSGRIAEVNSISSLLPSSGNAFSTVPSLSVPKTSNTSCSEGITSPSSSSNVPNTIVLVSHSESFPTLSLPCSTESRVLLNHVDAMQDTPLSAKASPAPSSSTNASEESSMDSIDEERKRCMQLAEIPTSTPGPPHIDSPMVSSSKADDASEKNTYSVPLNVKPVNKAVSKPPSMDFKDLTSEGHNMGLLSIRNLATTVQQSLATTVQQSLALNSLHNEVLLQPTVSINSTITKEAITEVKVPCTSLSETYIPPNCGLSLQKEQPESNTTVLTSDSTSSFIVVQDSVPLVGLESKPIPIKLDGKKEVCSDSVHLVSTSSNPVVTSLLSPVKYIPNEVSSQKFKLIFKGSGQRSTLQGSNSPTGLVVPINSTKTVPIKLVTLPGGGSALSVRSTSNPNIVEIIAPKTSASQNTQSGNPHTSSPVRLVVSKVPSGLSCTNQGGTQNMRNRVVVNRVVMTGSSPSLKLVSTSSLCNTTAVLSNSSSIATSSGVQSIQSSSSSSMASHVTKLFVDEIKPVNNIEVSSMQLGTVTCPTDQTAVETSDIIDNKISTENLKNMPKATSVTTIKCSSNADSTTKDSPVSQPLVAVSKPQEMTPVQPVPADSSTPSITILPDTTTAPSTNLLKSCNITSSDEFYVLIPSEESSSECVLSEQAANSKSRLVEDDISSKKSVVADTTTSLTTASEVTSLSSMRNNENSEAKLETTTNEIESSQNTSKSNTPVSGNSTIDNKCENSVNDDSSRTINVLAESDDLLKSEQTNDSAIKTSLNNISNDVEPSEPANSSSSNPCFSTENSSSNNSDNSSHNPKNPTNNTESSSCAIAENLSSNNTDNSSKTEHKVESNIDSEILNSTAHADNPLVFKVTNPCEIENEVTITSNVEVEVSETADCVEISQNCELGSDVPESAQNEIVSKEVVVSNDSDSLDAKGCADIQKFRPLGEESVGVVESADETGVVIEDSQLEISLVYSKPVKRKCSENAAELIKACMGVEDGPKRAVLVKAKVPEDIVEKMESEKLEENVRMSLRIRKDDPVLKKSKGSTLNSDCSTDEEITLSELVSKSRTREKQPPRGRISNRESPVEPNNLRPGRRRSGSNESRHSEEIKTRPPRENKRETVKRNEVPVVPKKLPERTKRGTFKAQEQVVISKVGVQRSGRLREQEAKASLLNNNKEESNSIGAKRKTRATADTQEMLVQVKRRRYSKDGHR